MIAIFGIALACLGVLKPWSVEFQHKKLEFDQDKKGCGYLEEFEIKIVDGEEMEAKERQNHSMNHRQGSEKGEGTNYLEQLQRLQADFANYKKRVEQQKAEWYEHAVQKVASELLPILDDFDHLFNHNQQAEGTVSAQGVKLIYEKLKRTLEKLGVKEIPTDERAFNPDYHEAIHMEESDQVPQDEIVRVWQKGYMYKDKLLRPAKVVVAKRKVMKESNGE